MEKNTIFDSFGYVLKEENFTKLNSKIVAGTLVVEDQRPYPGYHGINLPSPETAPGHIYFLTKNIYSWEEITSISHKIKKYIGFPFQNYDAQIQIGTKTHYSIRIKDLENYDQVELLQRAYQAEGILFEKDRKFGELGLTKLKKFFVLKVLDENVFEDTEMENTYYLVIPHFLSWEFFRKLTHLTRSNLPEYNFDAAQAVLYYRNEMFNTVRIYGCKCGLKEANALRSKYIELIKKYQ